MIAYVLYQQIQGERLLKNARVIEPVDIKKMLAKRFNVPESNIIKSQYTYTVVFDDEDEKKETLDHEND